MHSSCCPRCACCRGAAAEAYHKAAHLLREAVQWCHGLVVELKQDHCHFSLHREACYLHTLVALG